MTSCLESLPTGLKDVLVEAGGLKVHIFYLECLAQASYLVSHEGNAYVIDPRRDVKSLLELLSSEGLTLRGVLESHFHADFVSGHYELGRAVGVPVYFGPSAEKRCKFTVHELKDNEVLELSSRYAIKVLHAPGHTMESVVYLVLDKQDNNRPLKAFTGDTLFIGSCGRPDLVGSIGLTPEYMSRLMFNTLKNKIKVLPDHVQVFPAHGAGSPCGKNISSDLYSTIGKEKLSNVALSYDDEEEFVKFLVSDQPDSLGYFKHNVKLNMEGARPLEENVSSISRLPPSEFHKIISEEKCDIIDTRNAGDYSKQHIPGSLNFPLGSAGGTVLGMEDGNFAMWVGTCLSCDGVILLINAEGKESEALQRLARIGYSNIKGVLSGDVKGYVEAGYPTCSRPRVDLFSGPPLSDLVSQGYQLLDVRTKSEYAENTVQGAINIPLAKLDSLTHLLSKDKSYLTFCLAGFRSTIAASLLARIGFRVQDIEKGFAGISVHAPKLTTTGEVCPSMKAILDSMLKTT